MKKFILFLVFAIPVIITLTLRFFGENTFSIPIYYESGLTSLGCGISTTEQYRINNLAQISLIDRTSIVFITSQLNNHVASIRVELNRVLSTKVKNNRVQVLAIGDLEASERIEDDFTNVVIEQDELVNFVSCDLLISEQPFDDIYSILVLIDREGRIRGYFEGGEQEDFDRLSAELDILELEYQKNDE